MKNKKRLNDLIAIQGSGVSSDRLITSSRTWLEVADVMSKDVAIVRPDQTVVSAAKVMSEKKISCLVIMDNANVAGILTETDMLRRVVSKGKDSYQTQLSQIMSCPVESVPFDLSVLDASKIMGEKHVKRLPILDGDKLVGIVTQTDLVRALTSYGLWRDVSEIMSLDVAGIQSNASVAEAAEAMTSRKISCIVVLDGDEAVGVLTEKDLLGQVVALQRDPACVRTEEIMSSPVTSIPPSYSVFSASKIMEEMNIRRLVVIKGKQLCGVVTQTDIFMTVRKKLQAEEEKNFRLLEDSKSNIYTADLDGMTTYVNPAFMKLLEVSDPAELIGRLFLPERFWFDLEERKKFLVEVKTGSIESKELSLKTSKGKKIYIVIFPSSAKDIHGEVNGSQGVVYDITAKKELVALRQAEEALQKSIEEYKSLSENIPGLVYRMHLREDNRMEFFNSMVETMTGYKPEELAIERACSIEPMIAPEDRERVVSTVKKAVMEDTPFEIEYSFRHKDRHIREFLERGRPIMAGDGKPLYVDGVILDITERKRAIEALEYRIEFEWLITKLSKGFINPGNIDEKIDRALKAIGEFAGVDRAYVFQLHEDAKTVDNTHEWCAEGIEPQNKNLKGIKLDDKLPWFWGKVKALETFHVPSVAELPTEAHLEKAHFEMQDIQALIVVPMLSEGALRGFLGFDSVRSRKTWPEDIITLLMTAGENISLALEGSQAVEALRESERKYSDLVQQSPDAVISLDKIGNLLSFNPAAERISGFSAQEVLGRHFTKIGILAKESVPKTLKEFGLVLTGAERSPFELIITRKDKSRLFMEANGRLIKHKGRKTWIQVTLRDITKRKQAEEALEGLNKELESTNRELRRTNKEIQEFAYIAAHDLKTPLRGIGTLAHWISTDYADKFDEQGKEQVKLLTTRAKQMSALIDSVLQYSRLTKDDPKKQPVNLNTVLSEVIATIAPPENIEITVEGELPAIMCEQIQIMQVFQNLLSNAVKYMDKPRGQIKVGCVEQDGFWKFSVTDNGPGIDRKYFEKIFRIFQALSPRDKTESTGIGLSIVKKIAEMNGGTVWVESEPCEGSTFFFTLPK